MTNSNTQSSVEVHSLDGDSASWDEFVCRQPGSLVFQLYGWRNVVEQSYGHRGIYIAAYCNSRIVGALPLFVFRGRIGPPSLISVPHADYAGICAENQAAHSALLAGALNVAREYDLNYVELRHLGWQIAGLPSNETRVAPSLRLPVSHTQLWDSFRHQVRNKIRKASKHGISVGIGDRKDIVRFQTIFAHKMHRLGSPTHSLRFFQAVVDSFPDQAVVFVTRKDKEVIGGAVCLRHQDVLEVPWTACLDQYFQLGPSNALYWEIMRYAIEHKCAHLRFGSSPVGSGPYHFKMQWGAEAVPLRFQYLKNTSLPPLGDRQERLSYRVFRTVWRKLPLAMTNRLGPVIMKQLPL